MIHESLTHHCSGWETARVSKVIYLHIFCDINTHLLFCNHFFLQSNESLQNNSGLLCKWYSTSLPSLMCYFTQAKIQSPQISNDVSLLISVGSWWAWVNRQGGKNVFSPLLLIKCSDFLIRYIYVQIFALVGPLWGNEFQKANCLNITLLLYYYILSNNFSFPISNFCPLLPNALVLGEIF